MAAGVLPAPGSKYGPCAGDCRHKDCKATRVEAAKPCVKCGKPIGYDRGFYDVPYGEFPGLWHAECFEEVVEKEREARQ